MKAGWREAYSGLLSGRCDPRKNGPPLWPGQGALQYLVGALPDRVDELLNDQIDTFETWLFHLYDLLFHDGLKRQVWSEQASSENIQGDTQPG